MNNANYIKTLYTDNKSNNITRIGIPDRDIKIDWIKSIDNIIQYSIGNLTSPRIYYNTSYQINDETKSDQSITETKSDQSITETKSDQSITETESDQSNDETESDQSNDETESDQSNDETKSDQSNDETKSDQSNDETKLNIQSDMKLYIENNEESRDLIYFWNIMSELNCVDSDDGHMSIRSVRLTKKQCAHSLKHLDNLFIPYLKTYLDELNILTLIGADNYKNFLTHIIAKGKNFYNYIIENPECSLYMCDQYYPIYEWLSLLNR